MQRIQCGRGIRLTIGRHLLLAALAVFVTSQPLNAAEETVDSQRTLIQYQRRTLRAAVEDLIVTYGRRYPNGGDYLRRLDELERQLGGSLKAEGLGEGLEQLRREALLANPLLDFDKVLVVKRRYANDASEVDLGLPWNDECDASLPRDGYDNEIAVLSLAQTQARLATVYRPEAGGYVGEMDLHWDANRLLFTQSDATNWKLWEVHTDGTALRQVSQMPDDVDGFDACCLPDGRIVFGSTASYQGVPCRNGEKRVANLYVMNADGSGVRQLCFDQSHDLHPCVLVGRSGALPSLGVRRHQPRLPAAADGHEPRRHRPARGLRKQFVVGEFTVLPAAAARLQR